MSSAEQPITMHNRARFSNVGCVCPEQYCEIVEGVTSIAFAISALLLPQVSISRLRLSEICLPVIAIHKVY